MKYRYLLGDGKGTPNTSAGYIIKDTMGNNTRLMEVDIEKVKELLGADTESAIQIVNIVGRSTYRLLNFTHESSA